MADSLEMEKPPCHNSAESEGHEGACGAKGMEGAKKFTLDIHSESYPQMLREIENPPEKIMGIGNEGALLPGLAIVGARKATPYGLTCAERFASMAAQMGICVISGGAIGCDQASHKGALKEGGATVVVMGSGADVAYPKHGKPLFDKVVDSGGAIISELPWGTPPLRWAFVKRNRIIAGLAKAVLIVEAGLPSGTFTTADFAIGFGREVLVVPGSIFSRESAGSNKLLEEGATPIVGDDCFRAAMDRIFSGISVSLEGKPGVSVNLPLAATKQQSSMVRMLLASPLRTEELAYALRLSVLDTVKDLSRLETAGIVVRYPDGRFGVDARALQIGNGSDDSGPTR
ncbi:MAG: DNA-processing protein DprA [Coriobacteriales bacterium]|jgi:DNA processing protein